MSDVMKRLDEWVAKTGNGRYCNPDAHDVITPIQAVREEVREFVELVEATLLEPRSAALEIGLGDHGGGHVLLGLLGFCPVITVDNDVNKRLQFADMKGSILIYDDSHSPRCFDQIQKDAPYNLLYIDGDHTYEGVRRDYEMYSPLVRTGGLIAIHDLLLPGPNRFCRELIGCSEDGWDSQIRLAFDSGSSTVVIAKEPERKLHLIIKSTHVGLAMVNN